MTARTRHLIVGVFWLIVGLMFLTEGILMFVDIATR